MKIDNKNRKQKMKIKFEWQLNDDFGGCLLGLGV